MSSDVFCLNCNESQAAIRASQSTNDPIYCWDELYGEAPHHVFVDQSKKKPIAARTSDLSLRVTVDDSTGCIRWTGAHTPKGYGQISINGKRVAVHRAAWERANGPIPDGMEIDHVFDRGCRFRDCINVDHLQVVTHAENVRRQLARVTHCPQGHAYDDENTIVALNRKGYETRRCRTCKNARNRAAKRKDRSNG
jgi:hypothetical protein